VGILLLAVAGTVRAQGLDLRIGGFFPRGEETLFNDDRDLYLVGKSDFYGVYGGAEYNTVLTKNVELGLSLEGYSRSVDTSYRDYTRPGGSEIQQTLKFQMVPLGLTVRFVPTSKRTKVAPYVGGGIDCVFYKYEEYGDFIDFFDPDLAIYNDYFKDSGAAFGAHAVAGVRVYLNRDIAIVGEGRYQWAKADMNEDFAPNASGLVNTIDLSGPSFTVGVHVRF
jgi:outer membrane protein W